MDSGAQLSPQCVCGLNYALCLSQINMIQSIVADINAQTGESECRYYKERLLYLESGQRDLLIDSSRILSCHGGLKNNRGAVRTQSCLVLFLSLVVYQSLEKPRNCVLTFLKN